MTNIDIVIRQHLITGSIVFPCDDLLSGGLFGNSVCFLSKTLLMACTRGSALLACNWYNDLAITSITAATESIIGDNLVAER